MVFSHTDECSTGTIQITPLIPNYNNTFGRLEVCYDGHWGSVCDDLADSVTAEVACRQLGHREGQT